MIPAGGVMLIDPGVMTGAAVLWPGGDFSSFQDPAWDAVSAIARHCRRHAEAAVIGWERFDITPATWRLRGSQTALEVTGALRYIATVNGCVLLPPSPRDARKIASDEILRAIGWHSPGRVHANDAARHLFAWAARRNALPGEIRDRVALYLGRQDDDGST